MGRLTNKYIILPFLFLGVAKPLYTNNGRPCTDIRLVQRSNGQWSFANKAWGNKNRNRTTVRELDVEFSLSYDGI